MRRTEVLQGIRQMKFEEVYERSRRGQLSQSEAALVLGMTTSWRASLLPFPAADKRRAGRHGQ